MQKFNNNFICQISAMGGLLFSYDWVVMGIAEYKLGNTQAALDLFYDTIQSDKLDHFARFMSTLYFGSDLKEFYNVLHSNPSQTCIDIAFNLLDAGLIEESLLLLEGLKETRGASTMAHYLLAYAYRQAGNWEKAQENRAKGKNNPLVDTFPYCLEEIPVLHTFATDSTDYTAVYLLGCILYDKCRYEETSKCFEKAIEINPDFYIPYRNLAIAYFSKHNRKEDIPTKPSDNLTWDLANAYSNIFEYDKAIEILKYPEFVAAEYQETYLTETYTFALCVKGRLLRKEGKLAEAREIFRLSQQIPANFRAEWWDTQALYYAIYFEAERLEMIGCEEKARKVVSKMIPFIHSGYNPYMGTEVDYYVALAYQILGENIVTHPYMSKYVIEWEEGIKNLLDCKPIVTSLYGSYVPDGTVEYKATLLTALAYSRLFFNDKKGAAELFRKSLILEPDNIKARLELKILEE